MTVGQLEFHDFRVLDMVGGERQVAVEVTIAYTTPTGTRHVTTFDAILAPDCTVHEYLPGVPTAMDRSAYEQFIAMFRAALPDIQNAVEDIVAEGDKVVVRWVGRGTHSGEPLMGVPASGAPVTASGVYVLRIVDGKIVEAWDNWDKIPHKTSKAGTLGDHDFVVLQQPCFAVRTVQPQFAQGVAIGHPRLLGWLAAPGVLFGGDTDPHLTKGRCGTALATAPSNQGFAEAIYRFDLVMGYREFAQMSLLRW